MEGFYLGLPAAFFYMTVLTALSLGLHFCLEKLLPLRRGDEPDRPQEKEARSAFEEALL